MITAIWFALQFLTTAIRSRSCVAPTRRHDDGVRLKARNAFGEQTPAFRVGAGHCAACPAKGRSIVVARDYETRRTATSRRMNSSQGGPCNRTRKPIVEPDYGFAGLRSVSLFCPFPRDARSSVRCDADVIRQAKVTAFAVTLLAYP